MLLTIVVKMMTRLYGLPGPYRITLPFRPLGLRYAVSLLAMGDGRNDGAGGDGGGDATLP